MYEELRQLEKDWSERLREVQYVGELVIEHVSMLEHARILGKAVGKGYVATFGTVLTTIATNCAYYEYDEKGFWEHYFRILGIEPGQALEEELGKQIESWLLKKGFMQVRRQGPFRYVGPILQQTGITKKYLPKFSELASGWARRIGWTDLAGINFQDFKALVPSEGISRYLSQFLRDESGWEFTRDVAQSMGLLADGLISHDELITSKGFHPDFWADFLSLIDEVRPPRKGPTGKRIPLPRMDFLADSGQVALIFDQKFIQGEAYIIDGMVIRHPVFHLEHDGFFGDQITILVKNPDSGTHYHQIPVWNAEKQKYCIFSPAKGYLSRLSPGLSGSINILLPEEVEPPGRITEEFLGPLTKPIKANKYMAWRVNIDSVADLGFIPGFECASIQEDFPTLSWVESDRAQVGQCDIYEVFSGRKPRLMIDNPEAIREGLLAVVMDVGGLKRRLKIDHGERPIIMTLDVPTPSRGEIGIEVIGRVRNRSQVDYEQKLYFCSIPKCSVAWPKGLFTHDDTPEVKFEALGNVRLDLKGCSPLNNQRTLWKIPESVKVVEGQLIAGEVSVNIRSRVHRADLLRTDGPEQRFIDAAELCNNLGLIAEGLPKAEIGISLATLDGKSISLADLGGTDPLGAYRFNSKVFQDALPNFSDPAAYFCITSWGRVYPTPTVLLNTAKVRNILYSGDVDRSWYNKAKGVLREKLDEIYNVLSHEKYPETMDVCAGFPEPFSPWLRHFFIATAVMDEWKIGREHIEKTIFTLSREDADLAHALNWYIQARCWFENSGNERPSASIEELNKEREEFLLPEMISARWSGRFDALQRRIKDYVELEEWVNEWRSHVRGELYHSRLVHQCMGQELTMGWRFYLGGDFSKAHRQALNVIENTEVRTPVRELALLVKGLSALRMGLPEEADIGKPPDCHKKLEALLDKVTRISGLLRRLQHVHRPASITESIGADSLPVRDEDVPLLRLDPHKLGFSSSDDRSVADPDWLMLAAMNCWARDSGDTELYNRTRLLLKKKIDSRDFVGFVKRTIERLMES